MKILLPFAALLGLAACMGSGGVDTTSSNNSFVVPTPAEVQSDPVHTSANNTFAPMLNGVRSDAGAGAVSYDARLGAAAQGHANDMLANDFFSHIGSDGSTLGERVSAQGYSFSAVAENIAKGQQSESAVLDDWQDSDGHKANNENPVYEHFGLARAGSGSDLYWVLVLADPL